MCSTAFQLRQIISTRHSGTQETMASRTLLNSQKVDDTRDVSSELISGARTAYECAKCGRGFSHFSLLQIRSADEPMTTFYKCDKN